MNEHLRKDFAQFTFRELVGKLPEQLHLLSAHVIGNLVSNVLGDDFLSSTLRKKILQLLGAQFGARTVVKGGSYFGGGKLRTGAKCFIGRGCYFDSEGAVYLRDHVVIGHGVTFITGQHEIARYTQRAGPFKGFPIVVEDGAWVAANVTILPGVTIGRGSIVAAGTVVNKDVPPNTIVGGVPSKVIRELEDLQ